MKKLTLLLGVLIAAILIFSSCKKEDPIKPKPDYGEYYQINKRPGFLGMSGDGNYYTGTLGWNNLITHPAGTAQLSFDVVNNGKVQPVKINWKFVASTSNSTYTYLTWTKVQPVSGDVITNEKLDIKYD